VALVLVLGPWAVPAGSSADRVLLGRSPGQLRGSGWVLSRCLGAWCSGPRVDGGPFGRGPEVYGVTFWHGRYVVGFAVRLAHGAALGEARAMVLGEVPADSNLGAFRVSYAPGGDVAVATGTSAVLARETRASDPWGTFCVYLASSASGPFAPTSVRHVLVASWVKGADSGGC
jgi:hypothetical protein